MESSTVLRNVLGTFRFHGRERKESVSLSLKEKGFIPYNETIRIQGA